MFVVNDDLSIYATRGDIVCLNVSATDDSTGGDYEFQPGDIVRMKIFGKKDAESIYLSKDFPVVAKTYAVGVMLTEQDTKIGEVISKPMDYWYEIELNPYTNPQTIVGYDEDGAKIFKLFPEGRDLVDDPVEPEDIPVVDVDLDLTSGRPVENRAIARAVTLLKNDLETVDKRLTGKIKENQNGNKELNEALLVERARIDNLLSGATADDAEVVDIRVGADGVTYASAGTAVRTQIADVSSALDIIKPTNYAILSNSDVLMNPNGFEVAADGTSVVVKNLAEPVNGYVVFELSGLQTGKEYSLHMRSENFRNVSIRTDTDTENNAPGNVLVTSAEDTNGEWSFVFVMPDKPVTLCFWIRYSSTSATATNISLVEHGAHTKSFVKAESLRNIGMDNLSPELQEAINVGDSNPCDYSGDDICAFSKGLCIGDSLTQGTFNYYADGAITNYITDESRAYPAHLQKMTGVEMTNAGAGGHASAAWYEKYKDEDLSGYDFAIIQLGVNDVYRYGGWTETSENAFAEIVAKLKNENKNIKIFVSTIVPAKSYTGEAFDGVSEGIRNFVSALNDNSVILLDMASYGHTADEEAYNSGHLSAYGYWRLAKDYKGYISWYMKNNPNVFAEIQFIGTEYLYTH